MQPGIADRCRKQAFGEQVELVWDSEPENAEYRTDEMKGQFLLIPRVHVQVEQFTEILQGFLFIIRKLCFASIQLVRISLNWISLNPNLSSSNKRVASLKSRSFIF
jgi:hypothetical protein